MNGVFLTERERVAVRADVPEADCPPDGVLMQVRACGVCGGDLKRYRESDGPFPLFMRGHEYAGTVVRVGSEVTEFAVGDEVIQCYVPHCGTCTHCRLGHHSFCLNQRRPAQPGGGFADFVAAWTPAGGAGLFPRPPEFSDAVAAACEPAACAISAALRAQPQPGDWAAVVGLGAIGHFICQTLHAIGVRVIGVDISPNRIRAAESFCDETIDSTTLDPVATAVEITGGLGADLVYEAVGIESTLGATLQMSRVGGTAVLAGVFHDPVSAFDPEWIFRRDLTVIGGKGRPLVTAQGVALPIDFIQRGLIRPEAVVVEFPRSQAAQAFAAQNAAECLKAVLVADATA